MEEQEIFGVVSKRNNVYILATEDGKEYKLFAISPWESVPPEFDTTKFAEFVSKKVKASGRVTEGEIWNALVHCPDESYKST